YVGNKDPHDMRSILLVMAAAITLLAIPLIVIKVHSFIKEGLEYFHLKRAVRQLENCTDRESLESKFEAIKRYPSYLGTGQFFNLSGHDIKALYNKYIELLDAM
ncbi:hypothetical protein K0U07_02090, partial [bacterium]|nr:hypothetical protein [bacterium]